MTRAIGPFQQRVLDFVSSAENSDTGASLASIVLAMGSDGSTTASPAQVERAVAGLLERALIAVRTSHEDSQEPGTDSTLYYPNLTSETVDEPKSTDSNEPDVAEVPRSEPERAKRTGREERPSAQEERPSTGEERSSAREERPSTRGERPSIREERSSIPEVVARKIPLPEPLSPIAREARRVEAFALMQRILRGPGTK